MKALLNLISTTLIILTVSSASAAQLYWDPGQTLSNSSGGSGNWDTNDIFWYNGTADIAWTNANNDDAIFTGAAGTVTITNDISAGDIYFTNVTGSYEITNLTGAETLNVASTIDTGGNDHTIGALLANSTTLNKNGDGVLHLTGNNTGIANNVDINQGAISMETNSALGVNFAASITIAPGATLEFNGGANVISPLFNVITVAGTGVTNSGAMRNVSGGSDTEVNINLTGDTLFDSDTGRMALGGGGDTITANGNYNITAQGLGNVYIGDDEVNLGTGSVTVETNATLYMYVGPASASKLSTFSGVLVEANATYLVDNDNGFGTIPTSLNATNVIIDGGTLISDASYNMSADRGITVTTNGATIENIDTSGTWGTGSIYSSNADVTFFASSTIHLAGANSANVLNLGTGAIIKTGGSDCGDSFETTMPVFSNLVVNGGSFTFNYDSSPPSGSFSGLGSLPSSLDPSNIVLNSGTLHVGHTTSIAANRGIYLKGNGAIQDVTGGATITINSPISGPGSINFPLGKNGSSQTVVLAGANTYSGSTTIAGSITLNIGGSAGTLGAGNTINNGTLTFSRSGTYTYGGNISGSGAVSKSGSGTIVLTGNNTDTGTTTVSGGALLIDGTNGTGAISVTSGGLLGGTGVILGSTTIAGRLDLLNSTLSFSNNLTMSGAVTVTVNNSLTPSSGMAIVSGGTIANTGAGNTVSVSNSGPALAPGDTFQIFNQAVSGGQNMFISGGGVAWQNNLASANGSSPAGSITVIGPLPTPVFGSVSFNGTGLVMSGSNGYADGRFYVLSTTNLALPFSSWKLVGTNTFDANGNFDFTNSIPANVPNTFYTLKLN